MKIPYYSVVKDQIGSSSPSKRSDESKTFFGRPRGCNPVALRLSRGGADRDRTGNPRLAKPMLSQLSYRPGVRFFSFHVCLSPFSVALRWWA